MRRLLLVVALALSSLPVGGEVALAACAYDPDALSFHQMVLQGETGDPDYPVMILSKAIRIRDLGGGRGGRTIAKLAVVATPAGSAPLLTRVYFYRPPPGTGVEDNFVFHRGRWYVVIADRRHRDGFDFDGGCGQTAGVSRHRIHRLARLSEHV